MLTTRWKNGRAAARQDFTGAVESKHATPLCAFRLLNGASSHYSLGCVQPQRETLGSNPSRQQVSEKEEKLYSCQAGICAEKGETYPMGSPGYDWDERVCGSSRWLS